MGKPRPTTASNFIISGFVSAWRRTISLERTSVAETRAAAAAAVCFIKKKIIIIIIMRALLLVGGYGTRLRPLTVTKPKPLVEFANKSILMHQIEALVRMNVKEIVLAVFHKAEDIEREIREEVKDMGVELIFSHEDEPLGTAGPLALAKDLLSQGGGPFFVLNSDVICEYPFEKLLEFHKSHGREGTIVVTEVQDPSKYGVVVYEEDGRINSFIEKPKNFVSNKINAGMYILNPSVLDRIELRPMSIEKEVFPAMAEDSQLYAMELDGYWMDIGQPKDYLTGVSLHLESRQDANMIDPTAKVGSCCQIGPDVVLGPGVVVHDNCSVRRTTILRDAVVKAGCRIEDSIVGWKSVIGTECEVKNTSVLGEGVVVKDRVCLNGAHVAPFVTVKSSVVEPRKIEADFEL